MKALLSIKPKYVERIISGIKRYEYRRRLFARDDVDSIVVYSTMPVSSVVAEISIKSIISGSPDQLWERTKSSGGIDETEYYAYFEGASIAYAIELGEITAFHTPIPLSEYCTHPSRPPQSFAYVQ